jgi:hypothetical protein
MKIGEGIQKTLQDAGSRNHIVLAELPNDDVGGFSLAKGDQDGLTSLLILFFINYPELFISTTAVITRIFVDAGKEMAGSLVKSHDCDCPKCQERKKAGKSGNGEGEVSLEDFTVKGKYKN